MFRNVSLIEMKYLTISDCGGSAHLFLPKIKSVVIYAQNYSTLIATHCTFKNNELGSALRLYKSNHTVIEHCRFIGNFATDFPTWEEGGGGLSVSVANALFINDCTFTNNTSVNEGGAVSLHDVRHTVVTNVQFVNNAQVSSDDSPRSIYGFGGGLYATGLGISAPHRSVIVFFGYSTFINNSGTFVGGGLSIHDSVLHMSGVNHFYFNKVSKSGGAIYLQGTPATLKTLTNVSYNVGGGVAVLDSSNAQFNGKTYFIENYSHSYGGGLQIKTSIFFAQETSVTIHGYTEFVNNSADEFGGGIAVLSSTVSFTDINIFFHNSAVCNGGAIYLMNSVATFQNLTKFQNNQVLRDGGGLSTTDSEVKFLGQLYFIDNYANSSGGGIQITGIQQNRSVTVFAGYVEFTHNCARSVGGGLIAKNCSLISTGRNNFLKNEAYSGTGGAIFLKNATAILEGVITVEQNFAWLQWAGIFALNSVVSLRGKSYITANHARHSGGGIALKSSQLHITGLEQFDHL